MHPLLIDGLKHRGFDIDYQPDISLEETRRLISDYQGVVINSKIKVDAAFLASAPNLEFIARLGSGLEIINLDEAKRRGISVISAPEGNCNAVAEQALGMLLALMNKMVCSDTRVRDRQWNREASRGEELSGKTVGVIGYGHTGKAFATKLLGMSVTIMAHDPYIDPPEDLPDNTRWSSLAELQEQCDVISLHVSLNESSIHLIDHAFIETCSKPFYLINTSRGMAVDLVALVPALESGKVKGACLDVFENEKPETFDDKENALYSRMYDLDQVILSPHVAGWTVESKRKIAEVILQKLDLLKCD